MSFEAVFNSYSRIERHIKDLLIEVPYAFTVTRLNRIRELFFDWLDIYKEYAKGYSQELLTRSSLPVIRMLSFYGVVLEDKLSEIFQAKIPWEAYILLNEFFHELGHGDIFYILAEGDFFEQTSIYNELLKALTELSPPGPQRTRSRIDVMKTGIRTKDVLLIYYERGQYDNPLSWPLLLHEGLHYVYNIERLERLERNCSTVPWCQEALIDIYITNFFGPAYAISSAAYLQRFPYLEALTHPDFCARLYVSLLYLTDLINANDQLPSPMNKHVVEAFEYVKDVWNRHRHYAPEVQDLVEKIYSSTKLDIKKVISEKAQPFVDLLLNIEKDRKRVSRSPALDYLGDERLSISDVLEYYEDGIPVAVGPRILFNSFISKSYFRKGPSTVFITQSLKKWHLKKTWFKAKKEE